MVGLQALGLAAVGLDLEDRYLAVVGRNRFDVEAQARIDCAEVERGAVVAGELRRRMHDLEGRARLHVVEPAVLEGIVVGDTRGELCSQLFDELRSVEGVLRIGAVADRYAVRRHNETEVAGDRGEIQRVETLVLFFPYLIRRA